ncbi:MAG: dihydroorotase, partial [Clostridia bacterium]|nr:dihydroorotase [Clostridia bacterium]
MKNFTKTMVDETLISSVIPFGDSDNIVILPGFCDVHVHFREPGFSYKETIKTGSKAGAHGGYTSVCTMPNLNPVPHNAENIGKQLDIISKDAVIKVYPYGSITVDQKGQALADFEGLRDLAIAYSDDGRGVQSEEMMRQAMLKAKSLNKMIVAHCEVDSLLYGGYIHDGLYSALNNEKGIFSRSEWEQIARDIKLAKETGCAYHVCHISTKESVAIIRQAKKEGVNITCETAPHYLVLNDMDIQNEGRFKMNPPIRDESDRLALVEGILDGTIDMIATDHAPHSAEEKAQGLRDSKMGVVGLESAFSIMYTEFVKTGKITMERLLGLMCYNPKKRF